MSAWDLDLTGCQGLWSGLGENLSGAMPVGGLQVWSMVRAGLS